MSEVESFRTVPRPTTGLFKDKGSKFHAYVFPVRSTDEVKAQLEFVKKEHHSARHHCYAYRLGVDGKDFRSNDDGEPAHSAGDPILGAIDSSELTNVFIVVVRYFGGIKLGVGGLINAYRSAAKDALQENEIVTRQVMCRFKISFGYDRMNDVMRIMKRYDAEMASNTFEIVCDLVAELPLGKRDAFSGDFIDMHDVELKQLS